MAFDNLGDLLKDYYIARRKCRLNPTKDTFRLYEDRRSAFRKTWRAFKEFVEHVDDLSGDSLKGTFVKVSQEDDKFGVIKDVTENDFFISWYNVNSLTYLYSTVENDLNCFIRIIPG